MCCRALRPKLLIYFAAKLWTQRISRKITCWLLLKCLLHNSNLGQWSRNTWSSAIFFSDRNPYKCFSSSVRSILERNIMLAQYFHNLVIWLLIWTFLRTIFFKISEDCFLSWFSTKHLMQWGLGDIVPNYINSLLVNIKHKKFV